MARTKIDPPAPVTEATAAPATEDTEPYVEPERHAYLLSVVDHTDAKGKSTTAPFHYHSVAGRTFQRWSHRPDTQGRRDENGEPLMQRLEGALAFMTDDEVATIRERMAQRFVFWRAGALPGNKPGEPPTRIEKFKGEVKIVPPGRKADRGWEPITHFLRIEPFEG